MRSWGEGAGDVVVSVALDGLNSMTVVAFRQNGGGGDCITAEYNGRGGCAVAVVIASTTHTNTHTFAQGSEHTCEGMRGAVGVHGLCIALMSC